MHSQEGLEERGPTKEEVQIRFKEHEARGIFEPTAKRLLVCAHAIERACLDGKQRA